MDGFAALADPTRREIVDLLSTGELDAGTIAANFTISKPAVSRHLAVLRESGVVGVRRDAQRRVYSLRPQGLAEIDRWLAKYRGLWSNRLDVLEDALKEIK